MPAKMVRKILQSGGSKVTALPPNWLRAFGIKVGDDVEVIYNSIVLIKPQGVKLDLEFLVKELKIIAEAERRQEGG